ncbi:MAG TPA: AIR synthase-related protein, partial [Gemmatimonadales bacterium]
DLDLTPHATRLTPHELLFSETHGRAVITCPAERASAVQALAGELGVSAQRIGTVGPPNGPVSIRLRDGSIDEPVARLRDVYFSAIPRRMGD